MPRLESTRYTVLFATAVSVVCALLVATAAVGLRERQEANALLYKQKNVLLAAGPRSNRASCRRAQVQAIFDKRIRVRAVDLKTGQALAQDQFDAKGYDPAQGAQRPRAVACGAAQRCPGGPAAAASARSTRCRATDGSVEQLVLPIEGMGMWGTVYGLLSIDRDGNTVRGLTSTSRRKHRASAARSPIRSGRRCGSGAKPTTRTGHHNWP